MSAEPPPKIRSFNDLEIWRQGIKLVEDIYLVTRTFPKEELYGLTSQMRRSAVSVPSNIAEGFARFHNREYRRFLYMSIGSCAELTTQVIIASRLKYIDEKEADILLNATDEISRMTMGLIKKLNTNA